MKMISLALALFAASSCVGITYQRAGQPITRQPGLHTRVRFFHDAREFFPWGGSAQRDTTNPARITIYDARDTVVGELVLGRSTLAEAARLLSGLGGLGPRRDNEVTFHVGPTTLRPRMLYTPPATMHQLYFEQDTLVMVVAGVPHGLPATRAAFLEQFPTARETHRESMWYELQTPLSECVWLIAVFTTSADRLESNGWARVCSKDVSR